jgi:hypothetical protein
MKLFNALLAVAVCTGLVFAQAATTTTTTTTTTKTKVAKTSAMKVTGTVVSVDAISNTLILKVGKKEDTLNTNMETKITNAGNVVTLGDLTAGEKVKVECKKEEGKTIAMEIKVVPAATAAAKKPAEPKK